MRLIGQLREDILNGQTVLFLGAGASIQAGLSSGVGLANLLYEKTGREEEFLSVKDDLTRLVAKLDKNKNFTRKWVNNQIINYITDMIPHLNLDTHKRLFLAKWKAIFTTNFERV